MGPMNTAALPERYTEENSAFSGTKTRATPSDSPLTKEIKAAYRKIKAASKSSGNSVNDIALLFLKRDKTDYLTNYIRSKGEVPVSSIHGIILQAALLRMTDIDVISKAGNLSEDDALTEIEAAESEAMELNTADKDNVLPPDVQAALNCIIVAILEKMDTATGDSTISGSLSILKQTLATPLNSFKGGYNSAIGDDLTGDEGLDLNFNSDYSSTDTDGSDGASFWDILDKVAGAAKTISTAITQVSGSTSNAIRNVSNAVNTSGANLGASSISLYLQRNAITLLIVGALFVLLLVFASRATKN